MKHLTLAIFLCLAASQASARRMYVSTAGTLFADGTSWDTSTSDLNAALAQSSTGDTVWVAVGTYYGGFLMPEGVTVMGGFLGNETDASQRSLPLFSAEQTVLSGKQQYRVLEQPKDYQTATTWDGFVITQGIGRQGAGVMLRRNGNLRNCIVRENTAGLPAVGEYLKDEAGILLFVNASTKKGAVMSLTDFGRHYQQARAKEAVKSCNDGGKSDWRLPTNSEMLYLTSAANEGLYAFTSTFYIIENALSQNAGETLKGKHYWTSNTATESGNPVAYCFHTTNAQVGRMSVWGYQRIRPVRSVTLTAAEGGGGIGGGVYATDGSRLSGCLVNGNVAGDDEDIHVEGDVQIQDTDEETKGRFLAQTEP